MKPFLRRGRANSRLFLAPSMMMVAVLMLQTPVLSADLKQLEPVLKRDQLDRAATLLAPMLQEDADDPEVWQAMGEIEWRRGNTDKAEEHFNKSLSLKDKKNAPAKAGLGLVALDRDDYATAETRAREGLEMDKNDWLCNYVMGRVYMHKGDKNYAFEHFEKGKKKKGRIENADLFESGMAMLARADSDIETAENGFIKARGMAQNTVEHIMNLADHYEATGQWGNAVNLFRALGPAVENNARLAYRMGVAMEQQNRYQEAFQQYQKAVELDSTYAPALGAMGHVLLLDSRRSRQAAAFLEKAVAIQPTYQNQLDLGIAYVRLNKSEEAIPLLEAAHAENPDVVVRTQLALAYVKTKDQADKGLKAFEGDDEVKASAQADDMVTVGRAYVRKKNYDAAKRWFNLALEKEPGHIDAQYRLGYVALLQEDWQNAMVGIKVKLEENPKSASAWSRMGIAQQGVGDLPAAIQSYRRAAELRPKSSRYWNQLAAALSVEGNYTDAGIAYSRSLQAKPNNKSALRGRGFTYLVQEKYALAIKDLQAAASADPSHVDTMVYLGQAQLNSGQVDQAKVAFERAVELDPSNADALEGLDAINSRR